MKKQEKELFKSLCSFQKKDVDERLLTAATPMVLGQLFFNRMQGIAYGKLKECGLLGKVNREFRHSLKGAYEQNREKNNSFFACVQNVGEILSAYSDRYAMLKGAYLCRCYPDGYRTSNDIDLLVHPDDVTVIGTALRKVGFVQGTVRNGKIEPAARKEIIESKMMRGETVPYIKRVDLPGMPFLEVDINFSLDYKPGETRLLAEMIERAQVYEVGGLSVKTLQMDDFFIHLCQHLYKEATTLPWVEMKRDMTLYKYGDIYMLLNHLSKEETESLFRRAKMMETENICAFAVLQTAELFIFENTYAIDMAKKTLHCVPDFLHTVISPKDHKRYLFQEKDIEVRFFSDDRRNLLKEVV